MLCKKSFRQLVVALACGLALVAHSPVATASPGPRRLARAACPLKSALSMFVTGTKSLLSSTTPSTSSQRKAKGGGVLAGPALSTTGSLTASLRTRGTPAGFSHSGPRGGLTALAAATLDPSSSSSSSSSSRLIQSAAVGQSAAQPPPAFSTETKLGVLLLNLGGPENQDDVEGFLYNLFADPDIIRLPKFISGLQKPLATLLSKRRAPQSREAYESIGGGSPIVQYTTAQARLLEGALQARGFADAKCYIGMRYWYPFTEQALDEIVSDEVNALVILPLYPQFSISTSGSSLRVLQEEFAKDQAKWGADRILHTVVPAWYSRPGYVQSVAGLIKEELSQYTSEEALDGGLHVLFSAHGVPQSYIAAGDPYKRQMAECVDLIGQHLPKEATVHLSYQSRVGPVEWLRPYTDDKLRELGESGVRNLVVVPISFVSEHIETLEEIDMEYRELAEESGVTRWRRCPALNTDASFIQELSSMVVDALSEPTLSVSAACIQNNCESDLEELDRRLVGQVGVTESAETINGRLAMVGLLTAFLFEVFSGQRFSTLVHF